MKKVILLFVTSCALVTLIGVTALSQPASVGTKLVAAPGFQGQTITPPTSSATIAPNSTTVALDGTRFVAVADTASDGTRNVQVVVNETTIETVRTFRGELSYTAIAATPSGVIWLAWAEKRLPSTGQGMWEIYLSQRVNAGSWSAPVLVNAGALAGNARSVAVPSLVLDGENPVVAWNGGRKVYVQTYNGATPAQLTEAFTDTGGFPTWVRAAVSSGSTDLVWAGAANDGGVEPIKHTRCSNGVCSGFDGSPADLLGQGYSPSIAVTASGRVCVGYLSYSHMPFYIRASYVEFDGSWHGRKNTTGPDVLSFDGTTYYNGVGVTVAVDSLDQVHVVWSDARNGGQLDVFHVVGGIDDWLNQQGQPGMDTVRAGPLQSSLVSIGFQGNLPLVASADRDQQGRDSVYEARYWQP